MMIEAKCFHCGEIIKSMPPNGKYRYTVKCNHCGQEQFLERLPGMEFYAAIPFVTGSTPKESVDEYIKRLGFKADKYIDIDDGFVGVATNVAKLVEKKQEQYGDMISSMGPILKELYPLGIHPDQYNDLTLIVRIMDKVGRITKGNGEGDEDAWGDILGYAILGKANVQNRRS